MKRIDGVKVPKAGRFHEDVFGLVEYNAVDHTYRVKWFFWFQERLKDGREPYWGQYASPIFGYHIGGDEDGPTIYNEAKVFRSAKRALRHYHRIMAHADLVHVRRQNHRRAELNDWRAVR